MREFDYDMINRFIDGEMNAEERLSFEAQMLADDELRKEVELLQDINTTLKIQLHPKEKEKELRNTLEEMREEYFTGSKEATAKIISFNRRRWITAAAAVLIMAIVLNIWQPWQKDLYQQYASIEMPPVAERGVAADSLLKQASVYFNDKNFAASIPLFEKILKEDPQNTFAQYYYGIALLQIAEIERSRTVLTSLYNGSSLFKYDAAFYLALGYLKEKNKTLCKEWLNKIPSEAGIYVKAQELLEKL